MKYLAITLIMLTAITATSKSNDHDPYIWLEELEGREALEWVEERNAASLEVLTGTDSYREAFESSLEILNADDRIAAPFLRGDYIYNFWQDAANPRGVWRRTSKERYFAGDPDWDVLLDIDALSEADNVPWVYRGASGLAPDYDLYIVSLSRGGADAVEMREWDIRTRSFVDDGFFLPEAKGGLSWLNDSTLLVSTDFGEGTMTSSGYARQVRKWHRGTPINEATLLYEGIYEDVSASGGVINTNEGRYAFIYRAIDFYSRHVYYLDGNIPIRLDIPADASIRGLHKKQLIVELKSDWFVNDHVFPQASLVSIDFESLIEGRHDLLLIHEPGSRSSISRVATTQNHLLVSKLNNIISELYSYTFDANGWTARRVDVPEMGTIHLGSTERYSDDFFFYYQNFLTPFSLFFASAETLDMRLVRSAPAFFDSEGFEVWQHEAVSADGTRIPYFVVGCGDIPLDGSNPTLLYAYGGFEASMLPSYSALRGKSWLESGGVYVLANIRGGGEFGPQWHQAGLKENRQRVFDDFHAVAEDLIEKGITTGHRLGIQGGSNGGLLVGVAFTQRPELYGAVVCQVPLLDMQRYHKLLAGASWIGEYGNPDIPEEWAYIREYSPYHNLREDQDYPTVFFTTSTRDDRVHPGHARKMVAKMMDMGYRVYYWENMEGGHAGASTNEQRAKSFALTYSYLKMMLFD